VNADASEKGEKEEEKSDEALAQEREEREKQTTRLDGATGRSTSNEKPDPVPQENLLFLSANHS